MNFDFVFISKTMIPLYFPNGSVVGIIMRPTLLIH